MCFIVYGGKIRKLRSKRGSKIRDFVISTADFIRFQCMCTRFLGVSDPSRSLTYLPPNYRKFLGMAFAVSFGLRTVLAIAIFNLLSEFDFL